jgi:type IV secretion system protein VirB10
MTDNLNDTPMAPEDSPGNLTQKTGVRRVNNLPMYLIGGVMVVFLIIMVWVASDRTRQQNQPQAGTEEKSGNTSMFAREITGNQTSGIIPAAVPQALDIPDLPTGSDTSPDEISAGTRITGTTIMVARPSNLEAPPYPEGGRMSSTNFPNEEIARIRAMKREMFEEAVKAKTTVQTIPSRSSGSSPPRTYNTPTGRGDDVAARLAAVQQEIDAAGQDPTVVYKARLAQIQGMMGGSREGITAPDQPMITSTVQTSEQGDRWELNSHPEPPRTPFELRAGFVIPATLISGINSDLPGQITAQVSQTVYDTATGKFPLVPQGSRLTGSYSSEVNYGQSRVLVAWSRIIFPDGKAMDIGSMSGADMAGLAGFHDKVNNHYVRLFGSALLMSAVTAGVTYSQRNNEDSDDGAPSASSALSEALGQQIGAVSAKLIEKNMNIAPTLEIRPGYRLNVIVTKDLTFFKPYQAFDY